MKTRKFSFNSLTIFHFKYLSQLTIFFGSKYLLGESHKKHQEISHFTLKLIYLCTIFVYFCLYMRACVYFFYFTLQYFRWNSRWKLSSHSFKICTVKMNDVLMHQLPSIIINSCASLSKCMLYKIILKKKKIHIKTLPLKLKHSCIKGLNVLL